MSPTDDDGSTDDVARRLDRIEARLLALERSRSPAPARPATATGRAPSSPLPADAKAAAPPSPPRRRRASTSSVMAVGASLSFLLAAAYFVLLAIEHGWLTPPRQLTIATAFGLGLVTGGSWLSGRDRLYAAYLPAAGVGVLYLTIYAGHLLYGLFPTTVAFVGVAGVSILAIALGRRFETSAYTVLAAVGAYLTPILVQVGDADLIGIVIYFTAWSLLFSFLALQEGRRVTYLVALYLALLCFDATWRFAGTPDWPVAALYQLAQFAIFVATAVVFGVIHQRPMDEPEALFHGLPLFYFYLLEYAILKRHAPDIVVVAALSSVAVVIVAFFIARRRIATPASMSGAASLVATYGSVVTTHMVFGELLPGDYFAWGAVVLPMLALAVGRQLDWSRAVSIPVGLISGIVFCAGFVQTLVFERGMAAPAGSNGLLLLYAAALYGSYAWMRRDAGSRRVAPILLYLGHLSAMVVTLRWLESGLAISLVWAVLAVAALLLALRLSDSHIGRSSLFIFAASAVKVLMFDLEDSAPIIRVASLIVLGASLYAGGWLYQNLVRETGPRGP